MEKKLSVASVTMNKILYYNYTKRSRPYRGGSFFVCTMNDSILLR